jgi:ABC-type glycerol-3-phosphate transport system substrate-binding protein
MMVGRPWVNAALLEADRERRRKLAEAEALDEVGAARAEQLRAARIEWTVAPLPRTEQGATHLSVDWLVVMKSTDAREPAMRFARFMADEDRQRVLAMLGGVPATRTLAVELGETLPWAGHLQGLETARGLPLDQWDALSAQLGSALSYAISGRRTPAEALQRAGESG